MKTLLIYIVEDDENILSLELYALRANSYTVKGFANAKSFWNACREDLPQLILLDIMLPDEDGLAILKHLKYTSRMATIPVIMITAKNSEMDRVIGLDSGADDYIVKPFGVMELLSRIRAVLRRTQKREERKSHILKLGDIYLDNQKRIVVIANHICELTYKEFEILKLLLENQQKVFSREELMSIVWSSNYQGASRTVDMHIKTLRKKMGSAGQMVKTVRNVGYKIEG